MMEVSAACSVNLYCLTLGKSGRWVFGIMSDTEQDEAALYNYIVELAQLLCTTQKQIEPDS